MIQTAGVGVPTGDCVGIAVVGRCGTPTARCARSRNVERSNFALLVAQEAVSHIIRVQVIPRDRSLSVDARRQGAQRRSGARAWNVDRPTPYPQQISGVGAGLRWYIGSGLTAEFYYGKALRHVNVGNSIEDRGIYLRLTSILF